MKVVIAGSKGQLGSDCETLFEKDHDVVGVDIDEIDITDYRAVEKMIGEESPDVIVNCAAYTNVDAAETEREAAWQVNVQGPKNLAAAAKKFASLFIHVSTDYVFDGGKEVPHTYAEDDVPTPTSWYGLTKLEGERAVCEATDRYMIVRPAWMYGIHGGNFFKTMLRLALQNPTKEIKVVNDQFGSPTWSYSLARQIKKLIEVKGQGIYHTTSGGYCTWYEAAGYFLEKVGIEHAIMPCTTEEYPTPALRPKNSILKNARLQEDNVDIMSHWKSDMDLYVARFKKRLLDELKIEK
ncbi:MAG: dTDP-4-dehydrorhamnose reductase [Deltaproteobacteria bacterium]|nr:dTDP-4-dehydrorhamnose reductase [Deltaproteobacteria bacterium]